MLFGYKNISILILFNAELLFQIFLMVIGVPVDGNSNFREKSILFRFSRGRAIYKLN